jgi:hypothetical protein
MLDTETFGANSGILLLRRRIPLLFAEKDLNTVCFDPFLLSQALLQPRSGCKRAI